MRILFLQPAESPPNPALAALIEKLAQLNKTPLFAQDQIPDPATKSFYWLGRLPDLQHWDDWAKASSPESPLDLVILMEPCPDPEQAESTHLLADPARLQREPEVVFAKLRTQNLFHRIQVHQNQALMLALLNRLLSLPTRTKNEPIFPLHESAGKVLVATSKPVLQEKAVKRKARVPSQPTELSAPRKTKTVAKPSANNQADDDSRPPKNSIREKLRVKKLAARRSKMRKK